MENTPHQIDPKTVPIPTWRAALPRIGLRLGLICILVVIIQYFFGFVMSEVQGQNSIGGTRVMGMMLVIAVVGYGTLIAIPFVPGIEVGIALLLLNGASAAPIVYLATVVGLTLAFLIGQLIPLKWLHNAFRDLHLRRACLLISQIDATPPAHRIDALKSRMPRWLGRLAVDYRYVMLAILVNLPGTFAIGGGGGILMTAGISGLFRLRWIVPMLMLATAPVPLAVWLVGTQVLR